MEFKMKELQDQHAKQEKPNIMEQQEEVLAQFFVCRGKNYPQSPSGKETSKAKELLDC
jgi:hypothetical protein